LKKNKKKIHLQQLPNSPPNLLALGKPSLLVKMRRLQSRVYSLPHAVSSIARCDFLLQFFLAPTHADQGKYRGAAWYCGDGRLLLPGLLMAGTCIVADGKALAG
jgi:hypothetical protein